MANTIKQFEELLFTETDGSKFDKIKNKIIKNYAVTDRQKVIDIFIQYAKTGSMLHWRNFLLNDIIDLIEENELQYTDFFQYTITNLNLTYWGIDGFIKVSGKESYSEVINLAVNEKLSLETRAKAIKSIAIHSKQPFDRDLPSDPGYWKIEDLRIDELLNWQHQGYKTGMGYEKPRVHPNLKDPKTDLEKAVSKLDALLEEERKKSQDLSNPSNWLTVADEEKIIEIKKKWNLPANYLEFLKNFSPVRVYIDNDNFFQGLSLYGADDILKNQAGYAFNGLTNEKLEDWPSNYIVIADSGADPFCIDLGAVSNNDAPIYTSMHGNGEWEFEKYADSFIDFLNDITE